MARRACLAQGLCLLPQLRVHLLCADDRAEKGEEKDPAVVTPSDEVPAEEDHLGPSCYYDKSKSFFDNISSELKTRWAGAGGPGAHPRRPHPAFQFRACLSGPCSCFSPSGHSGSGIDSSRSLSPHPQWLGTCFLDPGWPWRPEALARVATCRAFRGSCCGCSSP